MARFLEYQGSRRYVILVEMAKHQSFGGGWASVRNPEHSIYHALCLRRLATLIQDDATIRKTKVFLAYAAWWTGQRRVSQQFVEGKLRPEAHVVGDVVQDMRCLALLDQMDLATFEHLVKTSSSSSSPTPSVVARAV